MLVFLFIIASASMALPVTNAATNCSACKLEKPFTESNGYYCFVLNDDNVACTCPDQRYILNNPCRICERKNICGDNPKNICAETSSTSLGVESNNTLSFACFCDDWSFTIGKPCASTATTTAPIIPAN